MGFKPQWHKRKNILMNTTLARLIGERTPGKWVKWISPVEKQESLWNGYLTRVSNRKSPKGWAQPGHVNSLSLTHSTKIKQTNKQLQLIWNSRVTSGKMKELDKEVRRRYCPDSFTPTVFWGVRWVAQPCYFQDTDIERAAVAKVKFTRSWS